jgi:hypothetical protein
VLTACLRFNTEAEEAASFYAGIFKGFRLGGVSQHTEAGPGPAGSVMLLGFELNGQKFSALNGGPGVHLQRGRLDRGAVRGPGRGRLLLGNLLSGDGQARASASRCLPFCYMRLRTSTPVFT